MVALRENTVHLLERTPMGPVFRAALPHLPRHPALGRMANELGRTRRARLRHAMRRAIREDALRAPRDLERSIDGILGAIYFRFLITQRKLDRAYVRSLLDSLV